MMEKMKSDKVWGNTFNLGLNCWWLGCTEQGDSNSCIYFLYIGSITY